VISTLESGRLRDLNTGELVRVKKGALRERVHLNDLKIYLRRRAEKEEAGVELVDILEYEQKTTSGVQEDVLGLEGTDTGGSSGVEWIELACGVG